MVKCIGLMNKITYNEPLFPYCISKVTTFFVVFFAHFQVTYCFVGKLTFGIFGVWNIRFGILVSGNQLSGNRISRDNSM